MPHFTIAARRSTSISSAVWYLLSRSACSAFPMMMETSPRQSRLTDSRRGAGCSWIKRSACTKGSSRQAWGRRPESSSNPMTPSEYTSERVSTF